MFGSRHSCLEFRFRVRVGLDTRAPCSVSFWEHAVSSLLGRVLLCLCVLCFVFLHAVRVLSAACIHVMSRVNTWLMSIALSCFAKPNSCPVFPLWRGTCCFVLFCIVKSPSLCITESSPHPFTPTLTHLFKMEIFCKICFVTSFSSLSEVDVFKLILSNHTTTCPLDPIPSHLFQAISPALTLIVNTSLHTGVFPSAFRQATS